MSEFELFQDIPMDRGHTLDQLTGRFQSLRDGLPELIKNSKDQYSRLGVSEPADRQIVIAANTDKNAILVLDFGGARAKDFEGWVTWSSRTASRSEMAADIEGGHGNGGKAFMVRGSSKKAFMDSCADGRRTKMGFVNDDPAARYKPGYFRLNGALVNNVKDTDVRSRLNSALWEVKLKYARLPDSAKEAFERRNAFTAVVVDGVRDWENRRDSTVNRMARDLPEMLSSHGQAAMTLETCSVWVLVDGDLVNEKPIKAQQLEPYEGFEESDPIPVPDELKDPQSQEMVSTGPGASTKKFLRLRTSAKNLRLSDELKARNVVRVWNDRNSVATWPLPKLVQTPASAFLYGELRVPALKGEHLADAHRTELADTSLARALEAWVAGEAQKLADKISRAEMNKSKPGDREKATRALDAIRDLMRQYLSADPYAGDLAAEGAGAGQRRKQGDKIERDPVEFGERIDEIILELMSAKIALASGTRIPLLIRCNEVQPDGSRKPVRKGGALKFRCADLAICGLDTGGQLVAHASGTTQIWFETGTGVKSNVLDVEAVECKGVDVIVSEEQLLQGQKTKLPIRFHTTAGPREDLLIEAFVDEPGVAWIGRTGLFTAGLKEGTATLHVKFGIQRSDEQIVTLSIGPDRVSPRGSGEAGGNIPDILLCGAEAPNKEDYPAEQRTHTGGEHFPTIIEEPQFPNVVWINPTSKESTRVRKSRGGPTGIGGVATITFIHFVALKCFEILKRLKVRQELKDQTVNETQFIQYTAAAEMDCASFIDDAYDLSEKLLKEEAPQ